MNRVSLPGAAWLGWLKNRPLRLGVLTGVYLTAVMTVALLVANRLPLLEGFADIRNWTCRLVFAVVMLIPIGAFLRSPWSLCSSGLSAWLLFSLAYAAAGRIFLFLHTRFFSSFHVFMLGALFYSVVAVALWVVQLITVLRTHLTHPGRAYHKAE
jgi:hypothetical protein